METAISNSKNFSISENLLSQWLRFTDVKEKSAATYTHAIRQFFLYLSNNNIKAPTADDVYRWRDKLKSEGKSAATVNLYLTSCKLLFKFLKQKGLYDVDISHVKGCKISEEHKKDALTPAQGKAVLNSFDTSTLKGLRDKSITALMMTCGLRTIEVSRANTNDLVNTYGRTALYIQGKGRDQKSECVMLPAQIEKLVNQYLAMRRNIYHKDFLALFSSFSNENFGNRLSTYSISKIVKTAFKSVGIDSKRLTAHSLRHSAATAMLTNGVELTKVQQILRHKNINTTLIYSHHLERLKNHGEDAAANAFFDDD